MDTIRVFSSSTAMGDGPITTHDVLQTLQKHLEAIEDIRVKQGDELDWDTLHVRVTNDAPFNEKCLVTSVSAVV